MSSFGLPEIIVIVVILGVISLVIVGLRLAKKMFEQK